MQKRQRGQIALNDSAENVDAPMYPSTRRRTRHRTETCLSPERFRGDVCAKPWKQTVWIRFHSAVARRQRASPPSCSHHSRSTASQTTRRPLASTPLARPTGPALCRSRPAAAPAPRSSAAHRPRRRPARRAQPQSRWGGCPSEPVRHDPRAGHRPRHAGHPPPHRRPGPVDRPDLAVRHLNTPSAPLFVPRLTRPKVAPTLRQ